MKIMYIILQDKFIELNGWQRFFYGMNSQYAIDSSPEKLSQYMYSTLCNGQGVYKHSRGHL